jgi:hypothetical protein
MASRSSGGSNPPLSAKDPPHGASRMLGVGGFWGFRRRKPMGQPESHTDDTSLPYAGCHVSIHAQISRDHRLGWYFFLKARTPHDRGEFKEQALNTFLALAESDRENIFKTLSKARIHIVDPRPYTVHLHDALRRHLPKGTTMTHFLRRLDRSTQHLAHVRQLALRDIATNILRDSPAERLKQEFENLYYIAGWDVVENDDSTDASPYQALKADSFDLTPFEHRKSSVLNDVANFVSASASVFSPVLDEFQAAQQDDPYFHAPRAASWLVTHALARPHAFDEGHNHEVEWIEQQRSGVLAHVERRGRFFRRPAPEPLQMLPSKDADPIQAADIAATIARELWYRNSLPHLMKRFEYITFNGERLSLGRAEQYESLFRAIPLSN